MFGPLGLSAANYIQSSRSLARWLTPIAHWYTNLMGYRQYGLKYDDLCQ
jgi:ubiquinol-cytochrome c reductase subunit 7